MLPSVTTTPQAIHTIRAIPTDPAPSITPLGEMKIPDPAKTTLHYVLVNILCTVQEIEINNVQWHFPLHVWSYIYSTTIFAIHVYNGV